MQANYEEINSRYIKYANFLLKYTKNKEKIEYLNKYIDDLKAMDYRDAKKNKAISESKRKRTMILSGNLGKTLFFSVNKKIKDHQ